MFQATIKLAAGLRSMTTDALKSHARLLQTGALQEVGPEVALAMVLAELDGRMDAHEFALFSDDVLFSDAEEPELRQRELFAA